MNNEQFESLLYNECKNACKKRDIVIAYDENGDAFIGDRKSVEKYYPNAEIVNYEEV